MIESVRHARDAAVAAVRPHELVIGSLCAELDPERWWERADEALWTVRHGRVVLLVAGDGELIHGSRVALVEERVEREHLVGREGRVDLAWRGLGGHSKEGGGGEGENDLHGGE